MDDGHIHFTIGGSCDDDRSLAGLLDEVVVPSTSVNKESLVGTRRPELDLGTDRTFHDKGLHRFS